MSAGKTEAAGIRTSYAYAVLPAFRTKRQEMAKGYRAQDYAVTETSVSFRTEKPELQELFDRCEEFCRENLMFFTDKEVLVEGSGSQPSFRVPTGLSGKG